MMYIVYIGEIIICLRLEVVDCVIECFYDVFVDVYIQEEQFVIKSKMLKFVFIEILVMIECFYVLINIQKIKMNYKRKYFSVLIYIFYLSFLKFLCKKVKVF